MANQWQPIETAPKDGTHILVCEAPTENDGDFGLFVQRASWWSDGPDDPDPEGWVVYCSLVKEPRVFFEPTHWMPIPPFSSASAQSDSPAESASPEYLVDWSDSISEFEELLNRKAKEGWQLHGFAPSADSCTFWATFER